MRLIDLVREHAQLPDSLDRIASSWRFDSFIHGDIKFENCVISPTNSALEPNLKEGALLIKLVDWELADFGEPAWDVGCLLQAYVYACMRSSLAHRTIDLRHRLGESGVQVEPMRCAVKNFWQRYCSAMGLDAGSRSTFLERAIQCASARMIQMALEVMHGQDEPPPIALSLLYASQEVMERPFEAALLLGIDDCQI
jgi:thiamine kinase-like enzyme